MNQNNHGPQVLIIDRQQYWRDLSARTLQQAGYSVYTLDNYDDWPSEDKAGAECFDLIILGCASIGSEELDLIHRVLDHKQHLLVLSTSLPWPMMRSLFLVGANDVANKPYEPAHLVSMVEQVIDSISPRDSYRAVRQGGEL